MELYHYINVRNKTIIGLKSQKLMMNFFHAVRNKTIIGLKYEIVEHMVDNQC